MHAQASSSDDKVEISLALERSQATIGLMLIIVGSLVRTLLRVAWEVGSLQILSHMDFSEAGAGAAISLVAAIYMVAQVVFARVVRSVRSTDASAKFWTDHMVMR